MVRRHVTATLSIIGSKLIEHVFSTSFLHCSHILIEFCMSDCSTSEASENVIPEVHTNYDVQLNHFNNYDDSFYQNILVIKYVILKMLYYKSSYHYSI